jgi:PqqD family protein of HPr-rel-A system
MKCPRRRDDVLTEPLEDETVVLDLVSGEYHMLNRTGLLIWKRCDGEHSLDQLADTLVQTFGLDRDEALADVRHLIEQLQKAELVQLD